MALQIEEEFVYKEKRKWTWKSPDCKYKNEIDYIISNKLYIMQDVSG